MFEESVTDFRNVIEEKLKAKRDALGETEQHLKKFSVIRDMNNRGNSQGGRGGSVRGRLGPPAKIGRQPLGSRLGPRVSYAPEDDEFDGDQPGLMSRVVVEKKSRDDALAEEEQKTNKKEKQRNRRMFGNLLGTLQKFKQDENRVKDREQKKRDIEKKIEEKTEKEKEEAKRTKNELFSEKKKQEHEIKILQVQMDRIEQFEMWEKNKRREMQYIRTTTQPYIFYMPKEHNEKTLKQFETSANNIEEEIKLAKATFEEDLLKIETKLQNPSRDDIEEAFDEEDEFEDENKPKSVIVRTAISENNGGKIQKRKHEDDDEEDNQDVEQSTQNPPRDKRSRRQESSNSDSESSKEMTKDEGEDEK